MNRREVLKGAAAAIAAGAMPVSAAASGEPVGVVAFAYDTAAVGGDITHTYIAEMGRDGMWRLIATGEMIEDIDAYMEAVAHDARMAA